MGWIAPLVRHHDHSIFNRFPETIICGDCNSADGRAKQKLSLPSNWSFSPADIRQFIETRPHAGYRINYQKAKDLYNMVNVTQF